MAATVAVGFVDAVVRVMAGYDPEMSLKPKQRESLKRIYEGSLSKHVSFAMFLGPTRLAHE